MKLKIIVVFLSLVCVCLAQSGSPNNQPKTQAPEAQVQPTPQANMPCGKEMAMNKDAMPHHDPAAENGKEAMSCCSGKGAMTGMKDQKPGAGDSASGMKDKKDCCANSDKDSKQAAMDCCAASAAAHCGMQHHDHDNVAK